MHKRSNTSLRDSGLSHRLNVSSPTLRKPTSLTTARPSIASASRTADTRRTFTSRSLSSTSTTVQPLSSRFKRNLAVFSRHLSTSSTTQEASKIHNQGEAAAPQGQVDVNMGQVESDATTAKSKASPDSDHENTQPLSDPERDAHSSSTRKAFDQDSTFKPTEPFIADNGDECLVIYEADPESLARIKKERFQSVINATLISPACISIAYGFIPTPYSYAIYAVAGIILLRNVVQVLGLSSFVTKITAVWPSERSPVSDDLLRNLDEMVLSIQNVNQEPEKRETEFEQRAKHNQEVAGTEAPDVSSEQPPEQDNATDTFKYYGQPGIDPSGNPFTFRPHAPDALTIKFGFIEAKTNENADDKLLYQRSDFAETTREWNAVGDPDFPEYLYIDRLNNGKTPLYQKVPLNKCAAFLALPVVPPSIPLLTESTVMAARKYPHDRMITMVRADATVTGLFPRFVKNVDGYNQIIFASYINARNEIKDRFQAVKGKIKL